jgi:hypothetical protein
MGESGRFFHVSRDPKNRNIVSSVGSLRALLPPQSSSHIYLRRIKRKEEVDFPEREDTHNPQRAGSTQRR